MKITGCGENRLFRTPFFEHALVSKTLLFFGSGISPYGEKKRKWPITQHHSPEGGKQPVGRAASQLPATGLTQMSPEGAKKALTRQVVSLEKHHSSISSSDRFWSSVQ